MQSTTSTIAITPNPGAVGQSITLTGTVVPDAGTALPTGTMDFRRDGNVISGGSNLPIDPQTGTVEFVLANPLVGNYTAGYNGNATFASSLSTGKTYATSTFPNGRIIITGGNNQFAMVNTQFSQGIEVQVLDEDGGPLPGAIVTFSAPIAAGQPSSTFLGLPSQVSVSDGLGIATSSPPVATSVGGSYNIIISSPQVPPPPGESNFNSTLTNFLLCMAYGTQILMGDGTWSPIQNIKRGDIVMGNPNGQTKYKVARLNETMISDGSDVDLVVFEAESLGLYPKRRLVMTGDHTVCYDGYRKAARRFQNRPRVTRYLHGLISKKGVVDHKTYALGDILPKEPVPGLYHLFDLQFETKGTYVAEGVVVKSRCPNSIYTPLPKDLYFGVVDGVAVH